MMFNGFCALEDGIRDADKANHPLVIRVHQRKG